jgi:hypothetical protein
VILEQRATVFADPAAPSPVALDFLALHVLHGVTAWRWHWCETMLRATAGLRTATLWRDDVDDLVQAGLMEWGLGCADVRPTSKGVELVRKMQRDAQGQGI